MPKKRLTWRSNVDYRKHRFGTKADLKRPVQTRKEKDRSPLGAEKLKADFSKQIIRLYPKMGVEKIARALNDLKQLAGRGLSVSSETVRKVVLELAKEGKLKMRKPGQSAGRKRK